MNLLWVLLHLSIGYYHSNHIISTAQQRAGTACLLPRCSCCNYQGLPAVFPFWWWLLTMYPHCCFWGKQSYVFDQGQVSRMSQYLSTPNSTSVTLFLLVVPWGSTLQVNLFNIWTQDPASSYHLLPWVTFFSVLPAEFLIYFMLCFSIICLVKGYPELKSAHHIIIKLILSS